MTEYLALGEAQEKWTERKWKDCAGCGEGVRSEIGIDLSLKGDGTDTIELSGTAVVVVSE